MWRGGGKIKWKQIGDSTKTGVSVGRKWVPKAVCPKNSKFMRDLPGTDEMDVSDNDTSKLVSHFRWSVSASAWTSPSSFRPSTVVDSWKCSVPFWLPVLEFFFRFCIRKDLGIFNSLYGVVLAESGFGNVKTMKLFFLTPWQRAPLHCPPTCQRLMIAVPRNGFQCTKHLPPAYGAWIKPCPSARSSWQTKP